MLESQETLKSCEKTYLGFQTRQIFKDWPRLKSTTIKDILNFSIKLDDSLENLTRANCAEKILMEPPQLVSCLNASAKNALALLLGKNHYELNDFDVEIIIRDARENTGLKPLKVAKIIKGIKPMSTNPENMAMELISKAITLVQTYCVEVNKKEMDKIVVNILDHFPEFIRQQETDFYYSKLRRRKFKEVMKLLAERLSERYIGFSVKPSKFNQRKKVNLMNLMFEEDTEASDDVSNETPCDSDEVLDDLITELELNLIQVNKAKGTCFKCDKDHFIRNCPLLQNATIEEKKQLVKDGFKRLRKLRGKKSNANRYYRPSNKHSKGKNGWKTKKSWNNKEHSEAEINNLNTGTLDSDELEYSEDTQETDSTAENDGESEGEFLFAHSNTVTSKAKGNESQSESKSKGIMRIPGKKNGASLHIPILHDTGCIGTNIGGQNLLRNLESIGFKTKRLKDPIPCNGAWQGVQTMATHSVVADLTVITTSGPVTAPKVKIHLLNVDTPYLFLGNKFNQLIGIPSQTELMATAARRQREINLHYIGQPSEVPIIVYNIEPLESKILTSVQSPEHDNLSKARHSALIQIKHHVETAKLNPSQKQRFNKLLHEHLDTFRDVLISDGPAKFHNYDIELKPEANTAEFKFPGYCYNLEQIKQLEQIIPKYTRAGMLIKVPPSHKASPIMVIPKPTKPGKPKRWRTVINLKKANQYVKKQSAAPVTINPIRSALVGAKFFICMDLCDGYWQIPIGKNSQQWYRIRDHKHEYISTRLLQGTTNGSIIFQDATNQLAGRFLLTKTNGAITYQDDLILYSESVTKLMEILEYILQRASQYNMKIKLSKCQFFLTAVDWLGYRITAKGISQSYTKTQALTNLAKPKNGAELSNFIGSINWIRQFLGPRYSELMAPLLNAKQKAAHITGSLKKTQLRKVSSDQFWSKQCDLAWTKMLHLIERKCHTLRHPDPLKYDINLFTDASNHFWSGMLTQTPKSEASKPPSERNHEPIGFSSGAFKKAQANWSTFCKEAYAIVQSIQCFTNFLDSIEHSFHIYTDHRNLQYIFNPYNETNNKATVGRVLRWAILLSRYQYTIHHINGKDNVFADMLSRIESDFKHTPPVFLMAQSPTQIHTSRYLKRLAPYNPVPDANAPEVSEGSELEESEESSEESEKEKDTQDNLIEPEQETIVNEQIRTEIPFAQMIRRISETGNTDNETEKQMLIKHFHSYTHANTKDTYELIKEIIEWPDMQDHIENWIKNCKTCLEKSPKREVAISPTITGWFPNHIVQLDFLRFNKSSKGNKKPTSP